MRKKEIRGGRKCGLSWAEHQTDGRGIKREGRNGRTNGREEKGEALWRKHGEQAKNQNTRQLGPC